ncbi:MAG: hypothetical protein KGL35_06875, partial [Bradyrhizobium sp.]|nr:hypothetical protein [Bradyrhizobium sp.]
LALGRQAVRNTYSFTVGQEYILLDPMDIIAITDTSLGLNAQWVRITEITENQDNTLTIFAEDYLAGTAHAPLYAAQPSVGFSPDYNAQAGAMAAPLIWEPTFTLSGALEVWIAAAGASNVGGFEVWVSSDGNSYAQAGTLDEVSRLGVTTAVLPAVAAATSGPTIDQTNVLSVDMSASGSQLLSGSFADVLAANTVCYVGGEYIAYETATLVSGDAYNLTYLNRGLYDTTPAQHASGTQIARLSPGTFFRLPFTSDRVGQVLYIKLLPYNDYGAGLVSLASVAAYPYTIQGTALAEPPPDVSNLAVFASGGITSISWSEVSDFRVIGYEIRKGASWLGAQSLGIVAHPPFQTQGDDTYWVAARAAPIPGIVAYSNNPQSIIVLG